MLKGWEEANGHGEGNGRAERKDDAEHWVSERVSTLFQASLQRLQSENVVRIDGE